MSDFTDSVVVITGAAGGIGRALCRRFAADGAIVVAVDRDAAPLAAWVAELGARHRAVVADVTDAEATQQALSSAVAALGKVDVLVNNAGAAFAGSLAELDRATWRREIAINLDGAYHCVEAVRARMVKQGGGAIVNIGSVNGLLALGHPAYSAAKAGLISYTKALAIELGRHGIRANVVCPGTVRTPAWDGRAQANPEIFAQLRKWYPLDRIATPEDVAEAAAFLASARAAAITGIVMPVDCGLTAGNAVMARELTLSQF
jgi:NAD(P)-dependent dehydrogenase (short-subunit alcohol dehydrogenase family)